MSTSEDSCYSTLDIFDKCLESESLIYTFLWPSNISFPLPVWSKQYKIYILIVINSTVTLLYSWHSYKMLSYGQNMFLWFMWDIWHFPWDTFSCCIKSDESIDLVSSFIIKVVLCQTAAKQISHMFDIGAIFGYMG